MERWKISTSSPDTSLPISWAVPKYWTNYQSMTRVIVHRALIGCSLKRTDAAGRTQSFPEDSSSWLSLVLAVPYSCWRSRNAPSRSSVHRGLHVCSAALLYAHILQNVIIIFPINYILFNRLATHPCAQLYNE